MIHYEVCIAGSKEPFHYFSSAYTFKEGERLFVSVNGSILSMVIIKITHNLTSAERHVVRLNVHSKTYH
jgi:hypothetical protein